MFHKGAARGQGASAAIRGWVEVTRSWQVNGTSIGADADRIALCSEVVDRWIARDLGDVEAMLAIALITEPGAQLQRSGPGHPLEA